MLNNMIVFFNFMKYEVGLAVFAIIWLWQENNIVEV